MDHYEIRVQVQSLGRALIDSEIDLLHLLGQVVVLALKRIGQSSGDLKELLIAYQDLPTSVNAKRVQHWYQPSKNLGHTTTIPTSADVQKTSPCNLIAQSVQEIDRALRRMFSVFVQFLGHRLLN